MDQKFRIAVIFGGPSPEHDVSVISAQQLMDAVDTRKYEVIPVHLGFDTVFRTGASLRDVRRYRPLPPGLREVTFAWGDAGPEMRGTGGQPPIRFDCALPVFHGFGEDGRIQGHFELLGIPVTGFSATHSGVAMRKDLTKTVVAAAGVNVVDQVVVRRGAEDASDWHAEVLASFGLPAIVKPASLGSSIGVGLAKTQEELTHLTASVLRQDTVAVIEPQVQNLQEYNVAVAKVGGEVICSAIERPKSGEELLDYKTKYLSSNGGAKGALPSEGMLSLTRDINPEMAPEMEARVLDQAKAVFTALGARGAPRLDFMCDSKTGEIWFNEINPIPGSYGFFLWEASRRNHLLFPELVDHLVQEALSAAPKPFDDPVPQDAYLLPR